jgi:hypothetical protein
LRVPEFLFVNRDHPDRFTRRPMALRQELAWYAPARPGRSGRRALRTWTLYATALPLVHRYVNEWPERLRCYGHLLNSLRWHRRWYRLAFEPIVAVAPRVAKIDTGLLRMGAAIRRAASCFPTPPDQRPAERSK